MVTVVDRVGWGAAPPAYDGGRAPRRRNRLYLHHTDRLPAWVGLGREAARWVQDYHLGLGWRDVGYPFLYSPTQREVYLGRHPETVGAHTDGSNDVAHALAVLGDYQPPSNELPGYVVDDLADFLRWYERQGFGFPRFDGGHRDAPGAVTACPGDDLHDLIPQVNRRALEDDMAFLSEEDQKFLAEFVEELRKIDAQPTSLAHVLRRYRVEEGFRQ